MAWLASGFPSGLFPAVRDLFLPECFGRRDRRIFIITVYLCTEFQIFSLFFFQPDCCFIKLVLEFFYLIQCIIPLFFLLSGRAFPSPGAPVSFSSAFFQTPEAYLPVPGTSNYGHVSFPYGHPPLLSAVPGSWIHITCIPSDEALSAGHIFLRIPVLYFWSVQLSGGTGV